MTYEIEPRSIESGLDDARKAGWSGGYDYRDQLTKASHVPSHDLRAPGGSATSPYAGVDHVLGALQKELGEKFKGLVPFTIPTGDWRKDLDSVKDKLIHNLLHGPFAPPEGADQPIANITKLYQGLKALYSQWDFNRQHAADIAAMRNEDLAPMAKDLQNLSHLASSASNLNDPNASAIADPGALTALMNAKQHVGDDVEHQIKSRLDGATTEAERTQLEGMRAELKQWQESRDRRVSAESPAVQHVYEASQRLNQAALGQADALKNAARITSDLLQRDPAYMTQAAAARFVDDLRITMLQQRAAMDHARAAE
jgi:hypothetical protein